MSKICDDCRGEGICMCIKKIPQWISVKDKLPPDLESVLLLYQDKYGEEVLTGHWDQQNKLFAQTAIGFLRPCCLDSTKEDDLCHKKNKISHWMPLPPPPT